MRGPLLLAVLLAAPTQDCLGVGREGALAIGRDGLGLISYQDAIDDNLRVAHCENVACTTATISKLEHDGLRAGDTSLAIDPDGLGLVTYASSEGLKAARCRDARCTTAELSVVDPSRYTARTSVAIGADGLPLIAYRIDASGRLKVAHCEDPACRVATVTTLVDDACCVGRSSALAVGADGLGLIVYYDDQRGLRVAHCEDPACTRATFSTVMDSWVTYPDVAIGADGLGLIVFEDGGWWAAHCRDLACSAVDLAPLSVGWSPGEAAVAMGPDGLPVVAIASLESLELRRCRDALCRGVTAHRVPGAACDYYPSIAIGVDGMALVSCWGGLSNPVLIAAHCRDLACSAADVTVLDGFEGEGG